MTALPGSGAEAQVGKGRLRQPPAELLQQLPLVVMGQLLQQDAAVHQHLEHAAAQGAESGVRGAVGADHLLPGLFEAQAVLPPAPAAGGEQAAQDLLQGLGAFVHASTRVWLSRRGRGDPAPTSGCAALVGRGGVAPPWRNGTTSTASANTNT